MPWLMAFVGVVMGGTFGVVAPVFVLSAFHLTSGSYEEVIPVLLFTLPAGALGGGVLGFLFGRQRRRPG